MRTFEHAYERPCTQIDWRATFQSSLASGSFEAARTHMEESGGVISLSDPDVREDVACTVVTAHTRNERHASADTIFDFTLGLAQTDDDKAELVSTVITAAVAADLPDLITLVLDIGHCKPALASASARMAIVRGSHLHISKAAWTLTEARGPSALPCLTGQFPGVFDALSALFSA